MRSHRKKQRLLFVVSRWFSLDIIHKQHEMSMYHIICPSFKSCRFDAAGNNQRYITWAQKYCLKKHLCIITYVVCSHHRRVQFILVYRTKTKWKPSTYSLNLFFLSTFPHRKKVTKWRTKLDDEKENSRLVCFFFFYYTQQFQCLFANKINSRDVDSLELKRNFNTKVKE